jgi:UPF0271 protein
VVAPPRAPPHRRLTLYDRRVLLNLDAGEHDDEVEELWQLFDVLAIACGGHAGDVRSMTRVVGFCARTRRAIGAHPSYPDRESFGRRTMAIEPDVLAASVAEQCAALAAIARAHGVAVEWLKPHGALYHDAAANAVLAHAMLGGAIAVLGSDLTVIGPPAGALHEAATAIGLRYAREGFADRRMRDDGSLVPRSEPDALLVDPAAAAAQAVALSAHVDTICIHADTPDALAIARAVRDRLG